jgi:membrane-associated phospholipid phosphatase
MASTPAQLPAVVRCSSSRFGLLWAVGLVAGAAAMTLAAPHDLAVTRAFARPGGSFGYLVTRFGEWPGIVATAWALVVVVWSRRRPSLRRHLPIAAALLSLSALHPLAMTQLLKWFWGRRRPDALGLAAAGYTPFYRPAGVGAGRSFPSGHVAISSVFVALAYGAVGWGAAPVWLGALAYPALVAAGRIIERRHFLCDTLFSLLSALLLAPLLVRWFHRRLATKPEASDS